MTFTKTKLKGTVHLVGYFKYTSGIHNGLVFNNSNVQIEGNRTPPHINKIECKSQHDVELY